MTIFKNMKEVFEILAYVPNNKCVEIKCNMLSIDQSCNFDKINLT